MVFQSPEEMTRCRVRPGFSPEGYSKIVQQLPTPQLTSPCGSSGFGSVHNFWMCVHSFCLAVSLPVVPFQAVDCRIAYSRAFPFACPSSIQNLGFRPKSCPNCVQTVSLSKPCRHGLYIRGLRARQESPLERVMTENLPDSHSPNEAPAMPAV